MHWLRYAFILTLAAAGLSLFGLAATSSDSRLFEHWFPVLNIINRVIAVLLFAIVTAMLLKLLQRFRRREFGARMTLKLAVAMGLLALIPCTMIYWVSAAFISRSIDSWFDVRVEKALDAGVAITRGILSQQQTQTETTARHMAEMLSSTPASLLMSDLMQLLKGHPNMEALVFMGNGTALAAAGSRFNVMLPDLPTSMQLQTVRSSGIYSVIDGDALDNPDEITTQSALAIRVIVPIPEAGTTDNPDDGEQGDLAAGLLPIQPQRAKLFLQVIQPVGSGITRKAAELVNGYRDYQTLVLSRSALQSIYAGTLFLVLLLAAFGAIAAAIACARKNTEPVRQLEQGTRRVADGNFQPIREFAGSSEINVLTKSFNNMIREISQSRRAIDEQRRNAELAQAHLERILGNISSGVIVLNQKYKPVSSNPAAEAILGKELCRPETPLAKRMPELIAAVKNAQAALDFGKETTIGFEFELKNGSGGTGGTPLFMKISSIALEKNVKGLVVVFDDVSQLMTAQRATAWGEVARRLAHEIKNPLTPIRLAAERLEMKLESKLEDDADAELLHRSIETITTQVDALKQMANDFRKYAKLPAAKLESVDLNAFIRENAALYEAAGTPIRLSLSPDLPKILGDAAQLRQVLHNLISNSIDAAEGDLPAITLSTRAVGGKDGVSAVALSVTDDGVGFSEEILSRAFEPYVTTKETGTGLGLPMVKKIIDEHQGVIELSNRFDSSGLLVLGAKVEIFFRQLSAEQPAAQQIPTCLTSL